MVLVAILGFGFACFLALLWGRCRTYVVEWFAAFYTVVIGGFLLVASRTPFLAGLAPFTSPQRGTVTVSESGLELETADVTRRTAWSAFVSVGIGPDRVYVASRPARSLLLTRRSFASDEEWSTFVDAIRRFGPPARQLAALPAESETPAPSPEPVPLGAPMSHEGPSLSVDVVVEAEDLLEISAASRLVHAPSRVPITVVYMVLLFVVLWLFLGATVAVLTLPVGFAVGYWILPALMSTALFERRMGKARMRVMRRIAGRQQRQGASLPFAARATLDNDAFTWTSPNGTTIRAWHAITDCVVKKERLVIRLAPLQYAIIPRRAFPDDAAWNAFVDFAMQAKAKATVPAN
jgi:hypothetical protein